MTSSKSFVTREGAFGQTLFRSLETRITSASVRTPGRPIPMALGVAIFFLRSLRRVTKSLSEMSRRLAGPSSCRAICLNSGVAAMAIVLVPPVSIPRRISDFGIGFRQQCSNNVGRGQSDRGPNQREPRPKYFCVEKYVRHHAERREHGDYDRR